MIVNPDQIVVFRPDTPMLDSQDAEILRMIGWGVRVKEIADRRRRTVSHVRHLLHEIYAKLGATDCAHAVAIACRYCGLFDGTPAPHRTDMWQVAIRTAKDEIDADSIINVCCVAPGRWVVKRAGRALSQRDTWDDIPHSSFRLWEDTHLFSESDALGLAKNKAAEAAQRKAAA